ncbi:hypothetical protein ACWEOH_05565 [Agromyces sp. NPDC004153]
MTDTNSGQSGEDPRTASGAVWWMVLGFVVILAALALVLWMLSSFNFLNAEVALTLVVVASVMVLILALAAAAIVFNRLGLADQKHAMGLPEGSIRAIIALLLILLFSVVAVFLITNADRAQERVFDKITQRQAEEFSSDQTILDWDELPPDDFGEDENGDPFVRLVLQAGPSPSAEMSQQLLTTLGTLVVAVASFYFGSQVVLTAKSSHPGTGPDPNVGKHPNSPAAVPPSTAPR